MYKSPKPYWRKRSSNTSVAGLSNAEAYLTQDLLVRLDSSSPFQSGLQSKICSPLNFKLEDKLVEWEKLKLTVNPSKRTNSKKSPKQKNFKSPSKILFDSFSQQAVEDFNLEAKYDDFWTKQQGKAGWVCIGCDNFNFEQRKKCNYCKKERSSTVIGIKGQEINEFMQSSGIYVPVAMKSNSRFVVRDGDWKCKKCKNVNFSFRVSCNRCGFKL